MAQIRVLEVPLKPDTRDYDSTHYLHRGWEDEDRRAIEKAIQEVQNSTQPSGTRTVDTANGEVTIRFEAHPDAPRRKLVKGYIKVEKGLNQRQPVAATFIDEPKQVRDDFRGPTTVEVPDLAGLDHSEASAALAAVGLRLGNRYQVKSEEAKGEILAQYPAVGTKVNSGRSVSITVSGPATTLVQGVSGSNLQGRRRWWRWRRWWWRWSSRRRLLERRPPEEWWRRWNSSRPLIGLGLLCALVAIGLLAAVVYPLIGEDATEEVEPVAEKPEPVGRVLEPVGEAPEPVGEVPEPPTSNFTPITTLISAGSHIAFSPDGGLLAIGGGKTVKLWDPRSRELNRTLSGHTGSIRSVVFSPGGRFLASGSSDDTIKVWNPQSGEEFYSLRGHKSDIKSVAINPNGGQLASGSADDTVKLWDPLSARLVRIRTSTGSSHDIDSVAFSPDGSLLASGDDNWAVKVWDPQNGRLLQTLGGYIFGRHYGPVRSVAFSPDGSLLASGSADGTVKVWDSQSGELLRTLGGFFSFSGHSDDVTSVAFSPDGSLLASGSADDTVKVWNPQSGEELQTLTGHSSGVESVAFSPGGRLLASGAQDGNVKILETAEDER